MSSIPKVFIPKQACPPKTWEWLDSIIRDHLPYGIYLIEDSALHREFRQRAWNEFHEHKLQNPS